MKKQNVREEIEQGQGDKDLTRFDRPETARLGKVMNFGVSFFISETAKDHTEV